MPTPRAYVQPRQNLSLSVPIEARPSSIVPQVLVTIGSGNDDLRSNPYTAKKRTVDPAQPPLLRQDARASLAERDLARETTQARLGRPDHRVTADPKPIREAGK
jgi:hypothetical protein